MRTLLGSSARSRILERAITAVYGSRSPSEIRGLVSAGPAVAPLPKTGLATWELLEASDRRGIYGCCASAGHLSPRGIPGTAGALGTAPHETKKAPWREEAFNLALDALAPRDIAGAGFELATFGL